MLRAVITLFALMSSLNGLALTGLDDQGIPQRHGAARAMGHLLSQMMLTLRPNSHLACHPQFIAAIVLCLYRYIVSSTAKFKPAQALDLSRFCRRPHPHEGRLLKCWLLDRRWWGRVSTAPATHIEITHAAPYRLGHFSSGHVLLLA